MFLCNVCLRCCLAFKHNSNIPVKFVLAVETGTRLSLYFSQFHLKRVIQAVPLCYLCNTYT